MCGLAILEAVAVLVEVGQAVEILVLVGVEVVTVAVGALVAIPPLFADT